MKKLFLTYILIIIIISLLIPSGKNNYLSIHTIDVGQGDSILIQTPNFKNILIDGGDDNSHHIISNYLKNKNVKNIDYVIANNKTLNNYVLEKYNCKNSKQVICDDDKLCEINTKVIKKNLIKIKNNFIRHDGEKLSKLIIDIVNIN